MDKADVVVIGAGIVGLAVARAFAVSGRETLVLEREAAIGQGISSRNSEVIHAGLHGQPDSLKARLCLRGRERLYEWCAAHGVEHQCCGKLLVATDVPQLAALQALQRQAEANGVLDVQWLDGGQARALEPALHCEAALLSPSTGIVDSHGLMLSLQGELERVGGMVVLRTEVQALSPAGQGWVLQLLSAGGERSRLNACVVVNAAGLFAAQLGARTEGLPPTWQPRLRFCKGNYFALVGKAPFKRLIYPMPAAGGLGVHLTLDLAGQARFGPDLEWLPEGADPTALDYRVEPHRGAGFYAAVRRYWPDLPDGALTPAYSGVRPKLHGPDEAAADFRIDGPAAHGLPGLVNLLGIESPGLTSCLAIADEVLSRL